MASIPTLCTPFGGGSLSSSGSASMPVYPTHASFHPTTSHHPNSNSRSYRNDLMKERQLQVENDEQLARKLMEQERMSFPYPRPDHTAYPYHPNNDARVSYLPGTKTTGLEVHGNDTPELIACVRKRVTQGIAANIDTDSPDTMSRRFDLLRNLTGNNKNEHLCQTITEGGFVQSQEAADFALKIMPYITKKDNSNK